MLNISAQQLADLLIGIARAQAAVVHGIDNAMAGTKTQYIVPALQNANASPPDYRNLGAQMRFAAVTIPANHPEP